MYFDRMKIKHVTNFNEVDMRDGPADTGRTGRTRRYSSLLFPFSFRFSDRGALSAWLVFCPARMRSEFRSAVCSFRREVLSAGKNDRPVDLYMKPLRKGV